MVSTPTRTTGPGPAGKPRSKPAGSKPAGKPTGSPAGKPGAARDNRPGAVVRRWNGAFWAALEGSEKSRSGSTYYLILGSTLALTAIGIMMVLSASSVEAIAAGESPYSAALKQGMFACIGLAAMMVLTRVNVVWLKRIAWPTYGVAVVLLMLVLLVGRSALGNKNWIDVGPFTFQPSEAAKLALALWMATVLHRKANLLIESKHALIPVAPGALVIIGLILAGNDLGTAMIVMIITAAALFFAGVRLYVFLISGVGLAMAAGVLAITSPNRVCRILSWTGQTCADGSDVNYQSTNGLYGLASGGWFGVGLGQSRQKYSWIPEAHNDFIFAIIGEELGLVGTFVVLVLFAILGMAIYRVVVAQTDMFHRVLAGTIMVWLLGQATVNMAVVTGLAPVVGIPLPFISYGGSALLMSLCAIGVVLSLARAQMAPGLQHRRLFGLTLPRRFARQGHPGAPGTKPAGTKPAGTKPAGTKPAPGAAGSARARPVPTARTPKNPAPSSSARKRT